MVRPSLIDKLGLGDAVLAMWAGREKSQGQIAAWVGSHGHGSMTQSSVSRWLAVHAPEGSALPALPPLEPQLIETPAAELVSRARQTLEAVTRVKVDQGGQADARYFLDACRDIVAELRALYADTSAHPQLRAKAMELAVAATIEGHEMAVDLLVVTARAGAG